MKLEEAHEKLIAEERDGKCGDHTVSNEGVKAHLVMNENI